MIEAALSQSFLDIQRPRLLLVDDEPSVLRGLQRVLATKQPFWEIHTAKNGEEAVEKLGQFGFDLVITDLQMPRLNGWSLLFRLRKDHPETLRVVHSSQSETMSAGVGHLAHRTLPKPSSALEILEISCWALQQRSSHNRRSQAPNTRCA
jgi:DNA-binding NarL/FixJ family response regulator